MSRNFAIQEMSNIIAKHRDHYHTVFNPDLAEEIFAEVKKRYPKAAMVKDGQKRYIAVTSRAKRSLDRNMKKISRKQENLRQDLKEIRKILKETE